MNAATRADWGAHVDGRIKKVLQDLNIRMARSLGAAVNQALAKEREGIKAELVLRDARITALEERLRAATNRLLAEEHERKTAELVVCDARVTTVEEEFGAAVTQLFTEEREGIKPELTVRETRM